MKNIKVKDALEVWKNKENFGGPKIKFWRKQQAKFEDFWMIDFVCSKFAVSTLE